MIKQLGFSLIFMAFMCLIACDWNNAKGIIEPDFVTRKVIWDEACSGTATVKGRVEFLNGDCGSKYAVYAVKMSKIGIYDSITRGLIDTRFEVINEVTDRKKIVEQEAATNFSTTLEAGFYLMYAYPVDCSNKPNRHWSFGDTIRICGNEVKDFGTVKL